MWTSGRSGFVGIADYAPDARSPRFRTDAGYSFHGNGFPRRVGKCLRRRLRLGHLGVPIGGTSGRPVRSRFPGIADNASPDIHSPRPTPTRGSNCAERGFPGARRMSLKMTGPLPFRPGGREVFGAPGISRLPLIRMAHPRFGAKTHGPYVRGKSTMCGRSPHRGGW